MAETVLDGDVAPTSASAAAAASVTAPELLFEARILADRLNVRAEPSTVAPIVAKLLQDDRVQIISASTDGVWYEVLLADDSVAWIAAEFAREIPGEAEVEESVPAGDVAAAGEASGEEASGEEAAGEEAADEETAGEETANEEAVGDEVAFASATRVTEPTAVTQPDIMNVRGGPGTNYPVVANAPAGSALLILAKNAPGDWYQVQLPESNEPGWVLGALVELRGPLETLATLSEEELPPAPEGLAEEAPSADDVSAAAAVQPAAVVNAPAPTGGGAFGYGVQAHMLGGGIDKATNATAAMGFNWMKQQVEWRVFEGSQGNVDFSELRRIADAAGGRGINLLFSVVNAPDWAREPGFDAGVGGPPADPQTYAAFVGRLAGEFCGTSLKAIEVWNEQNLHYEWGNKPLDPAEYMNLLRPAYGSIKAACPSMLVISGAPTPGR